MTSFHPHLLDQRLRVVRVVVWATLGLIIIAFFRTQILGHGRYQLQSENNRLRPITLPAPRGIITDRNGKVIADNVPGYTVALLPDDTTKLRATLRAMSPTVKLNAADIDRVLQRYRRAPYQPALVLANASFAVISALEERRVEIPGLVIQTEPKRYYPDSALASHLVGYVGEATEQEIASPRRVLALRPGSLVGKDGLEREYDDSLRGSDGIRFVEVNATGHVVREAGAAPTLQPVPGTSLRATVDVDLQRYIAQIFPAGQRGAVVALDPSTGEILALYSAPGYEPNAFVGGVDPTYWRSLNASEAHPLFDRAIQARYPPGSTWKLAVAAIALRRGIVTLHSRMPIPCRGGMQYGNRFFRCWEAKGHGDLTLQEAIAQSCDVYFYQLGLKVGLTSLIEDANTYGFRTRTGIDLPGEIPPQFPNGTEYFDRVYGPRHWTAAVTLNLAIGQGENAQTLINMTQFYQMLASDGRLAAGVDHDRGQDGDGAESARTRARLVHRFRPGRPPQDRRRRHYRICPRGPVCGAPGGAHHRTIPGHRLDRGGHLPDRAPHRHRAVAAAGPAGPAARLDPAHRHHPRGHDPWPHASASSIDRSWR